MVDYRRTRRRSSLLFKDEITFNPCSPIDNILVEKAKRQMHLRNGDNVVKTYRISLGKDVGF